MEVKTISKKELQYMLQHVEHKMTLYDGEYGHSIIIKVEMDEYVLITVPPVWIDDNLEITKLEVSEDEQ